MPGIEGFAGADVEQLRALATALDDASRRIEGARQRLDGPIRAGVAWTGPWADRFRSDWSSGHAVRLHGASEALHGAAAALRRNADEQAGASAVRPSAGWAAGAGATARAGAGSFAGVTGLAGLAAGGVSGLAALGGSLAEQIRRQVQVSDPTRDTTGTVDPEQKADGDLWVGGGRLHVFERNPTATVEAQGVIGGVPVSAKQTADAGVSVTADAAAHMTATGITAAAGAALVAHAAITQSAKIGELSLDSKSKVEARVEAKGSIGAGLTADGLQADAHGSIGASVSAEQTASASLFGISATGHARVEAGAEATFNAGLHSEKGIYHFNLDAGAAVGLGGGGGVELAIDPKELARNLHIKVPW